MKVDSADLVKLLEIQEMDNAIKAAKHKASVLPVHQTIGELTRQRTQLLDDHIAAKTAVLDAGAAQQRAEADVIPVKERLARNQARVDAGEMDPKALSTAIEEIAHLKHRIAALEDAELEAMEASESANSHLAAVIEAVKALESELREQVAARDEAVAQLAQEAKQLGQARAELGAQLPGALMGLYEKIAGRSGGVGVAKLVGHRCAGCGLEATVADYNAYLAAPSDELIRCQECDRVLVRS
ncbi:MAG: nucleic acid-binding protein [Propionibacteriaceae bacterium]|jgi:predicted  nucleic acid-binding Zn-ribbon protein|nr:nucleic acid-binding protein [Propionibacteriaceae bacterium]